MKTNFIIFIFLFTLFNVEINADTDKKAIAVVNAYSGTVKIIRTGKTLNPSRAMVLHTGDEIITLKSSKIMIMLKNSVKINVYENTKIKINPLTGENFNKYSITQYSGAVKSNVKNLPSGASYDITTPATIAGVRGTEFSTVISVDGATAVVVEQGSVDVSEIKQKNDLEKEDIKSVTVKQGFKAEVQPEKNTVQVTEEKNPGNFIKRFIQRRLNHFKRNHKRILRFHSFRVGILIRRFNRGKRVLSRMHTRVKRFDPVVMRIISRGNRFAIRRIARRVRRFRRRTFRIIHRMRRIHRRLRAVHYISQNIEDNLKGHKAVKSKEFKDFRTKIKTHIMRTKNDFPKIKEKMRRSARIIRKWKKIGRKSMGNNRGFRRRRFRRRHRRFRRRR